MTHPAPQAAVEAPEPVIVDLDGTARIIHGDALASMRLLADNSVDALCTDPPYGLSKEPDPVEVLTHWLNGDDYVHTGSGFMGASWDSFVPGPSIWREAFRVLKPGGYGVVFASSRTIDLTMMALRLAGFEIRETIMWVNAQGFPKSLDLNRALTKAGDTENAEKYAGFGTALKPGHEPIALVRKPLVGTVAANVTAHGTGGLNIGACRVQNTHTNGDSDGSRAGEESAERRYTEKGSTNFAPKPGPRGGAPEGRFPANVIFTHAETCTEADPTDASHTGEAGGAETEVPMSCAPGCPLVELDAQSGIRTSGKPGTYRGTPNRSATYGAESRKAGEAMTGFGDTGGASRFFPSFKYTQKATRKERATVWIPAPECVSAGHSRDPHDPATPWFAAASTEPASCGVCTVVTEQGDEVPTLWAAYQHSTVKPVAVMEWLTRLVTPAGGVVLDPFAGTGTTGVAAVAEGFHPVLIERDPAHVAMIHARLSDPIQTSLLGSP